VTFAGTRPRIPELPGIHASVVDGATMQFEVTGGLTELLAELSRHDVTSLTSRLPSLEEIFLHHYDGAGGAPDA